MADGLLHASSSGTLPLQVGDSNHDSSVATPKRHRNAEATLENDMTAPKRQRKTSKRVCGTETVKCNVVVQWFDGSRILKGFTEGKQGHISKKGVEVKGFASTDNPGDLSVTTRGFVRNRQFGPSDVIRVHDNFVHEGRAGIVVRDSESSIGDEFQVLVSNVAVDVLRRLVKALQV